MMSNLDKTKDQEKGKEPGKSSRTYKDIIRWVEAIAIAMVIALFLRAFVVEPVIVDGSSMENTLLSGDRLIIYKLGYSFSPPQRGDIIVLQMEKGAARFSPFLSRFSIFQKAIPGLNEVDYIKRVIAVPGDEVDIRDGFVYVNGEKIDEPYVKVSGATEERIVSFPLTVQPEKVLVMGDNREYSQDSRNIGMIDYERIKGKAVFRMWPFHRIGSVN